MRTKSFQLLGHNFKVYYLKRIDLPDGTTPYGAYFPELNKMVVATHSPTSGEKLPEEFIQHSLYHEIAHAMMFLLGKHRLFRDEVFIDGLGGLMAQYMSSKK